MRKTRLDAYVEHERQEMVMKTGYLIDLCKSPECGQPRVDEDDIQQLQEIELLPTLQAGPYRREGQRHSNKQAKI